MIPGYDPIATAGTCTYDEKAGEQIIRFFGMHIRHAKGALAGECIQLEPWQQAIWANAFGWKRPDGTRRYREIFIFVPRKNGKTTQLGGLINYMLFCDGEKGAEIYSAACDADQAALVYEQAKSMCLSDPELSSRGKIHKSYKSITFEKVGNFYRPLSADADTKHGFNSHCVVIDELHAMPEPKGRELVDVLVTSTGSRRQPMIVYITTSDYERKSICNEKYQYACKVRDGIIHDQAFLPVIYEASRKDDWKSIEVWRKANPNFGISISEEYFERECKKAQEISSYENVFKRLHLNIRTEQNIRWIPIEKWNACGWEIDKESLKGKPCMAGLDLSTTTDISALVLLFRIVFERLGENGIEKEQKYIALPFFWAPRERARERQNRDHVPYLQWSEEGLIELTPGDVVDYDIIRARINELNKIYNIREIAIDRWNATQITTQLTGDGFKVVPFGQGYASMSAPMKELEKIVVGQSLIHGGHPVLLWMASNVGAELDAAGNIKPSKEKSTEKIDGIVALIMALGREMVSPALESVYKKRGILFL